MREDDLPALFAIEDDPGARHMAAFLELSGDLDKYLAKHRRLLADDTITSKVIMVDGELAGSVAAFPMEGELEVTYWIARDFWGKGVATLALSALLRDLPVRPIYARAAADNTGSIRVLERNGFARQGIEHSYAEARGTEIDEVVFQLA
jgi:RimJ/RimL family protein N-acetyltransferase